MTPDEFLRHLRQLARTYGSQKALAEHCGVNPSWLSDILRGRRDPGQKLLTALGFRRVVTYERLLEGEGDAPECSGSCSGHEGAA